MTIVFNVLIAQKLFGCKQIYCSLFGYLKIKLRYNIRYSLDLELDAIWFRYPIDLITGAQIVLTHDVNRDRHDQRGPVRAERNWFDVLCHLLTTSVLNNFMLPQSSAATTPPEGPYRNPGLIGGP